MQNRRTLPPESKNKPAGYSDSTYRILQRQWHVSGENQKALLKDARNEVMKYHDQLHAELQAKTKNIPESKKEPIRKLYRAKMEQALKSYTELGKSLEPPAKKPV